MEEYVGYPYHEVAPEVATEGDLSLISKWYFINDAQLKPNNTNGNKNSNIIYMIENKRFGSANKNVWAKVNMNAITKLAKSKGFKCTKFLNMDAVVEFFDKVKYQDNKITFYPKGTTDTEKEFYDIWFAEHGVNPIKPDKTVTPQALSNMNDTIHAMASKSQDCLFIVRFTVLRDKYLDFLIGKPFAVENYYLGSYLVDFMIHGSTIANKTKIYTASYKDFYKDYANANNDPRFLTSEQLKKMKLYHISPNPDLKEMFPRVPDSRLSYENAATKRVCFAPSIANCISAIPPKRAHGIMYVYIPVITDDTTGYRPSKTQVSDIDKTNEIWLCTDVKLKKIGTIDLGEDPRNPEIRPAEEAVTATADTEEKSTKLTTAERNALKDSQFGLPSQRKYPLCDEAHVRQAIRFFNYCKPEDRDELAKNIIKAAKKYNVNIAAMNITNRNVFSRYLGKVPGYKKANESFILL